MPAPTRPFVVYLNHETSEISGEHDTLREALRHHPQAGAQIVQNGTVMATAQKSVWILTHAGRLAL